MKECVRSKDHSRNTIKCGSETLVYHVTAARSNRPQQNGLTHGGCPALSFFEGGSCNVEHAKCTHPRGKFKSALLDSRSIYAECPKRYRTHIATAGTQIFGAILLEGFYRLIIHIIKADQTHRMLPGPMDLQHAR